MDWWHAMAQKHADDLRVKIVEFVRNGGSRRAAAREFGVSPSSVIKLLAKSDDVSTPSEESVRQEPVAPAFSPEATVEVGDLADMLGVSKRSITEFATRGIVVRVGRNRFHLMESVRLYCDHLRTVAAGRGGENSQEALAAARTRLANEQTAAAALKNAALRRELLQASDVEREWAGVLRLVRSGVLAAPSRLRQKLPHLTIEDVDGIDSELRRILEDLANVE